MNAFNSSLPVVAGDSPFDALMGEDGRWSARDLQSLMGYDRWERFESAVERAVAACENSGSDSKDHFRSAAKKVSVGSGAIRSVADWQLTRFAAYLVAMNGDPRKPEIAAAQAYFAVKTHEAETAPTGASGAEAVLFSAQQFMRMAQQLVDQERRAAVQEERTLTLEAKVSAIEGEHDYFTALAYAKRYGLCTEVAYLSRVGKRATKIAQGAGLAMGGRSDARWGSVKTYPAAVLDMAFSEVKPK